MATHQLLDSLEYGNFLKLFLFLPCESYLLMQNFSFLNLTIALHDVAWWLMSQSAVVKIMSKLLANGKPTVINNRIMTLHLRLSPQSNN